MAEVTEQGFVLLCRPPLPLPTSASPPLCQSHSSAGCQQSVGGPPTHREDPGGLPERFISTPSGSVPRCQAAAPQRDRMRSRHGVRTRETGIYWCCMEKAGPQGQPCGCCCLPGPRSTGGCDTKADTAAMLSVMSASSHQAHAGPGRMCPTHGSC